MNSSVQRKKERKTGNKERKTGKEDRQERKKTGKKVRQDKKCSEEEHIVFISMKDIIIQFTFPFS